jgi:hypothetical protein
MLEFKSVMIVDYSRLLSRQKMSFKKLDVDVLEV